MIDWSAMTDAQRAAASAAGLVPPFKKRPGMPSTPRSQPTRLEARFYQMLAYQKHLGRIADWSRPIVPFRLAHRTTYLPDATVFCLDGKIDVCEIKGPYEYDDGSRTKCKIAASLFYEHRFWFIKRIGNNWHWWLVTAEHGIRKHKAGPEWFI